MSFPLPVSLSPSKVASFRDCGLAFRFSAIDRLPEPPSPWTAKGTLVHRALERLFWEEPPAGRTEAAAVAKLHGSVREVLDGAEYAPLELDDEDEFVAEAEALVRNLFLLEDPRDVKVLGVELRLEVQVGTLRLRGIIDRLEVGPGGELVVTDYKTGRAPGVTYEQGRLGGVHFYAFLCEQVLGRRPDRIQLLHLREPMAISTVPTEQTVKGLRQRTTAVWAAVEQACAREDFRPRPGRLCTYCSFQAFCPAFGGDPALAASAVRPLAELAPA